MNEADVALFHRAEALANSGQAYAAHKVFCALRERNPQQVEVLFWIATTATNPFEAKRAINTIRRLQPNHPRFPALLAFHKKKQRQANSIRLVCLLYLGAFAFIFPIAAMNPPKIIAITCIVLCNLVLVVNIVSLAVRRVMFTTLSALYLAALAGFFMATATGTPTGIPEWVFRVVFLYILVYTVSLAVRGVWTGRV